MESSPDPSSFDPRPQGRTLADRWAPDGALRLDGPLERRSLRSVTFNFLMGVLALGGAFLLFQVVVSPILLLVQIGLSEGGMASLQTMANPDQLLSTYTRELIVSNSGGQLLGLALPTLLMARLHTRGVSGYLRLRSVDLRLVGLAVVGVVGMQPVVQWLAQLNQNLPLPESVRLFEQTQLEMIRSVLDSGFGVGFNVAMLALVPGICEELLFRGYAQRQFERATGPVGGILLSGIIFGVYHLRPSQVLPLVVLGVYLAYLTWRTGSLWPAVIVHITHNALAVLAARYARSHPDYDLEAVEQAAMPWYAVLAGFAIVGGVLYILHPFARRIRDA